jgi:hypothetical protein
MMARRQVPPRAAALVRWKLVGADIVMVAPVQQKKVEAIAFRKFPLLLSRFSARSTQIKEKPFVIRKKKYPLSHVINLSVQTQTRDRFGLEYVSIDRCRLPLIYTVYIWARAASLVLFDPPIDQVL